MEDRRAEMRREYEARRWLAGLSPRNSRRSRHRAGPGDVPRMVNNNTAMAGWSYDDRPAVSKAAMHEAAGDAGATPRARDGSQRLGRKQRRGARAASDGSRALPAGG